MSDIVEDNIKVSLLEKLNERLDVERLNLEKRNLKSQDMKQEDMNESYFKLDKTQSELVEKIADINTKMVLKNNAFFAYGIGINNFLNIQLALIRGFFVMSVIALIQMALINADASS